MPNRQRTMRSFYTAAGARVPSMPAPHPAQVAAPAQTAPRPSYADELRQTTAREPGTRRSVQRRMPEARARRPQPHRKIGAATFTMHRRRGVWRPSKTHCEVSLPATTPTGGARMQRHTSLTPRTTTGPAVLLSTTPTSLCSGRAPLSSTLPRVSASRWWTWSDVRDVQ